MVNPEMHETEKIAIQVVQLYDAIDKLLNTPNASTSEVQTLISIMFEETQVTIEELRVSSEQLRIQNSELSQVESILKAEHHRYRSLFEHAPIGYIVTDINGTIQEINQAAAKLLNIFPKYVLGKPLVNYFSQSERRTIRKKIIDFTLNSESDSWESQIQSDANAQSRHLAVTIIRAEQWDDQAGKSISLRWLLYDITERKQSEATEREQFLRATFDQAPVGIAYIDLERQFLRVNQKLAQFLGYTPDELLATRTLDITFADDVPSLTELYRRVIADKLDSATTEVRYIRKDGHLIWVHLTVSPVRATDGKIICYIKVMEDITQRKDVEIAEREQRILAESLQQTAMTLTSTLNLSEVLDHIVNTLSRIVPHEAASLMLIDNGQPHIVRGWGYNQQRTPQLEKALQGLTISPMQRTLLDEVIETKSSILVSNWLNPYADSSASMGKDTAQIELIRSLICAPIIARNEVIGFLELHSTQPDFFSDKHRKYLEAFAAQAAVAIQNARVHEQAQALATLEERQRLARDLHDEVTQTLFAASLAAETTLRLGIENPEKLVVNLEKLHLLTKGALAEMRGLLLELRPDYWLKIQLSEQLPQLVDAVRSRKEIEIQTQIENGPPIPQSVQIALYRIAQEALNNVVKHSQASLVQFSLKNQPDYVTLTIHDNGIGFDHDMMHTGFGMDSMRERAEAIQATFQISSQRGNGTQVEVIWLHK